MTEGLIQQTLNTLFEKTHMTTIVIAHRLSTVSKMERILVFDQGRILQDGPPDMLIKQEGLYQTLWNAQVSGFLPS